MSTTTRIAAGSPFPTMTWPLASGGDLTLAGDKGWRLLVVYRGKHCPLCKKYLATLNDKLQEFEAAGIKVAAVSADPREKAETEVKEEGWRFPVAYDMSLEQMRELGLYISDPRSPQETDWPFAEPAIFAINPDGNVQVVDISNAPFSRPDLASLLSGLKFIQEKQYPVRGTKA
jgi:peroxiredoxin